MAPALDLGLISILRVTLEILLGELSGCCTFLGELLADERVFRHFWSRQCRNLRNFWCWPSPSLPSYWPRIYRRAAVGAVLTIYANRFPLKEPPSECSKTVTAAFIPLVRSAGWRSGVEKRQ